MLVQVLDSALLRPGRFDRQVTVDRPDVSGRVKILKVHSRGKQIGKDVDFDKVARRTPGALFSHQLAPAACSDAISHFPSLSHLGCCYAGCGTEQICAQASLTADMPAGAPLQAMTACLGV